MSAPGPVTGRKQIPLPQRPTTSAPQRQPARHVRTQRCQCGYWAPLRRCRVCQRVLCDCCAAQHHHEEGS